MHGDYHSTGTGTWKIKLLYSETSSPPWVSTDEMTTTDAFGNWELHWDCSNSPDGYSYGLRGELWKYNGSSYVFIESGDCPYQQAVSSQ